MVRVRVYKYKRHAVYWFNAWTRAHEDELLSVNRHSLSVVLKNGDELHFVCKSAFERWAQGKKYSIDGWNWGNEDETTSST